MAGNRFLRFIPIIFWAVIIAIKLIRLFPFYHGEELVFRLNSILITSPLDIISFCFFYYITFPNLIKRKRLIINSIISFAFVILYSFLFVFVYHMTGRITGIDASLMIYKSSLGHTLLSALYAIVLLLSVDWVVRYRHEKELEELNKTTELALLRSQINPHFLFNTLNNINSFSTRDPEKTSFAIIKLSDIMRYMLYDAANETVMLEQEVEHINNYISLQKLRYEKKDFVKFNVTGNLSKVYIPPMIFLPFVENAFKHGSISVAEGITIDLKIDKSMIRFICKNKIKQRNDTEKTNVGGLGIKNIKRRLELLFTDSYDLNLRNDNNNYTVDLKIYFNR